jgi:hypothetical protein
MRLRCTRCGLTSEDFTLAAVRPEPRAVTGIFKRCVGCGKLMEVVVVVNHV